MPLLGAASMVLALAACANDPFEGYMRGGCDYFRDAVMALEADQRSALKDALRHGGGFDHPALDEYGGSAEKLGQIRTLRAGYDSLGNVVRLSSFDEPPRALTPENRADIAAARSMCDASY